MILVGLVETYTFTQSTAISKPSLFSPISNPSLSTNEKIFYINDMYMNKNSIFEMLTCSDILIIQRLLHASGSDTKNSLSAKKKLQITIVVSHTELNEMTTVL
jgi:hypothetical protein